MLVIGLVGGVASGKSFVAECFAGLGAEIIDADKIGHAVLNLPTVVEEIQSLWPEVVVDQKVDRKLLAGIVFHSETQAAQLAKLEQITHPYINHRIAERLNELQSHESIAVVLDAPVLFKAGWQGRCDKIVFVESSPDIRAERAESRGWPPDELEKREQSQTCLSKKRQLATDIVNNSGPKHETLQQVRTLWIGWGLPCFESPLLT